MRLVVRNRRPGDPKPAMSFSAYVHLLSRAGECDKVAIDCLERWASTTPKGGQE